MTNRAMDFRWGMQLGITGVIFAISTVQADDWTQFGGPRRDGVWNETGILQIFSPGGLKIRWRAPVGWGLSSPVVAQGRVYLIDSSLEKPRARERIHCWDEKTGQTLWTHLYEVELICASLEAKP